VRLTTGTPPRIKSTMPSPAITWIQDRVRGKTFCDIGGIGVGAINERISTAVEAGASRSTMIDFRGFDHPDWKRFDEKMSEVGISQFDRIEKANLEDRGFPAMVGQYDIVHSTGILYHAPAPMLILDHLSKITRETMIVSTVIAPPVIENAAGRIDLTGSQWYFLPGINDRERRILQLYFSEKLGWTEKKFNDNIPVLNDESAHMPYVQWKVPSSGFLWSGYGDLSYSPYWWMFTQQAFEAMIQMLRFRVTARHWYKDHAIAVLCDRIA